MTATPIDTAGVEELLTLLYREERAEETSDPPSAVEDLAMLLERPVGDGGDRERALASAPPDLREAFLLLSAERGSEPAPANVVPIHRGLAFRRAVVAASCIAASVTVAIFAARLYRIDQRARDDGMIAKGATDVFAIGVARSSGRTFIKEGDTLEEGDRIGFFYGAEAPGYLTVVDREEKGEASVVVRSQAIEPGEKVPLSDGAVVERAAGSCEWLIAVFSNQPIDSERVRERLAAAAIDPSHCRIAKPEIRGARSVVVFPVRR